MDVWCKAFCCRHIYFKTVLQRVSKHTIFIQKIEIFFGRGHSPCPDPILSERGSSFSHDPRVFGAQPLTPSYTRIPNSPLKVSRVAVQWLNENRTSCVVYVFYRATRAPTYRMAERLKNVLLFTVKPPNVAETNGSARRRRRQNHPKKAVGAGLTLHG